MKMNYIDSIKEQTVPYVIFLLLSASLYGIMCHLGWRDPVILTPGWIVTFMSASLTFIFFRPFLLPTKNK